MLKRLLILIMVLMICMTGAVSCFTAESIAESSADERYVVNAIPMQFRSIINEQQLKTENKGNICNMISSTDVCGGRAYIYEKADDEENFHGGFAGAGGYYDLGAVGSRNGPKDGMTCVRVLELYGKTVLKFQGVFGSHVSNTSYFIIEGDIPASFLSTEGITTEMDIDGDGIEEIVAELPGTSPSVSIFEWDGNTFLTAGVNEALNAAAVAFNKEDGSFSAYYRQKEQTAFETVDYCYIRNGMQLKKAPSEIGDVVSDNTVDYNRDSAYERIIVRMTEGKQYEEVEPGPFQGWNWQGKFVVQLIDSAGNTISGLDLNGAFNGEELTFNRTFLIQFDDYNNDGNKDFAIGQYGSSNFNCCRLFTVRNNRLEQLPVETGDVLSGNGAGRHGMRLEKYGKSGFLSSYYDNGRGKVIKQYFVWNGSAFVLKSSYIQAE